MLTEEAHHMFVGETGVGRIIQRTCEVMKQHKTDDVRALGCIDLPTIQKYLNFHFSVSLDLFGQEASTNAANYYTAGLKGRYLETRIDDDHRLAGAQYGILGLDGGAVSERAVPALTALNERLRQDYIDDCAKGVLRWNKIIERAGIDFEMKLPHRGFNRRIGAFAGAHISPDGKVLDAATWQANHDKWLPSDEDRAYVTSLMGPAITEPGKFANWIAPPARGINNQPADFAYVRFN
jgi:benzoyl-CoA 2,3-dioxygenase component B